MSYAEFLSAKLAHTAAAGLDVSQRVLARGYTMAPHQADLASWALRRGRAAIFADTGLGKTRMQLAWADRVAKHSERVKHDAREYPVEKWQRVTSPVWMDIDPNDTLQYMSAREHDDERHICPLQLEVIRRGVELWTNPGDIVLSPFAGIGSEGYVSVQMGRKFIGVELKESYYRQACANLFNATRQTADLFTMEA